MENYKNDHRINSERGDRPGGRLWWHPLGVAAAAGMALLLLGAVITHRRAAHSRKETAPALLTLAITVAYLAIALTS